jgi:hypothetical protein
MGVYLAGILLIGVHLRGILRVVHLLSGHFANVHLTGVYLLQARFFNGHARRACCRRLAGR